MRKFTHCFFDMDGTLINSAPGVTSAVSYAMRQAGLEPPEPRELYCFIGPPLVRGFSEFCGMDSEKSLKAVENYRVYYLKKGIFECEVYPGIPELLDRLNRAGVCCVLATCKPHESAERVLKHFGLEKYFTFVSGPEFDGTRNDKHEVIAYAMERLGVSDPERILMIGDRDQDVNGAKVHQIGCVGVLWGFGSAEELKDAGAARLFSTPEDLGNLICNG